MNSKKIILLLVFSLAVLFLIFTSVKTKPKQEAAEVLNSPSLEIKDDMTGRKLTLSDFKDKVLFINFWASWCPPCKEEMPSIESLFKSMSGNEKFQMITILYEDPYQNGIAHMKQSGYSFPVYSDINGITARNFGVTGVPETYIIDKKGNLRKRVIGPAEWDSPETRNFINSLLNE